MMGPTDLDFARSAEFVDRLGWIWTVYPVHSSDPMVANGQAPNQERARARVEESMTEAAHAAFGAVLGPGGQHELCRRTTGGEFSWRPMFPG